MWRNAFWDWWDKYSGFPVGVALTVAGIVTERFLEPHLTTPRWQYVIAAATPNSFGDPMLVDETPIH